MLIKPFHRFHACSLRDDSNVSLSERGGKKRWTQRGQRGENERGREEEGVGFGQRMNSHIRKHVIPAMANSSLME